MLGTNHDFFPFAPYNKMELNKKLVLRKYVNDIR